MDRERTRDGRQGRGPFLGWCREFAPDEDGALAGRVGLYLFPGGYCGLSRVEGGGVHFAGMVDDSTRRRLAPGWDSVVAHARESNRALDRALARLTPSTDFKGAGPVYLAAKPPTQDGALMVGDAAGVVDPFSGQGTGVRARVRNPRGDDARKGILGRVGLERRSPRLCRGLEGSFSAALRMERRVPASGESAGNRPRGGAMGRRPARPERHSAARDRRRRRPPQLVKEIYAGRATPGPRGFSGSSPGSRIVRGWPGSRGSTAGIWRPGSSITGSGAAGGSFTGGGGEGGFVFMHAGCSRSVPRAGEPSRRA